MMDKPIVLSLKNLTKQYPGVLALDRPLQQSVNFAAKARALLGADKVMVELLSGAGHADPAFMTPQNIQQVLDFLVQTLRT